MIIAIYARVSTDGQELEAQIKILQEFASKKYPDAKQVLYDEKISGTLEVRDQFDKLFKEAHQLKFDHLLFYDFSRFTRTSIQFTFQKLWELENLKITFESYNEVYLSSMGIFREPMIAFITAINKAQRDLISLKTKQKLAYIKEKALKEGKPNPLGRPKGKKDSKKRKKKNYFDNQNASKKQKKDPPEITS